MTVQTVRLGGKRFVIAEEKQYLHLMRELDKVTAMSPQDWGDVAESKRRIAEPGASVSWERIKAERAGKSAARNGKRRR
jgi:hypothetical protein